MYDRELPILVESGGPEPPRWVQIALFVPYGLFLVWAIVTQVGRGTAAGDWLAHVLMIPTAGSAVLVYGSLFAYAFWRMIFRPGSSKPPARG